MSSRKGAFMKKIGVFLILATTIILGFYFYSTRILRFSISANETFVNHYQIPNVFNGARIVQFGDLLIENEHDLRLLEDAVAAVNRLNPTIIVFTGNLFEENAITNHLQSQAITLLSKMEADVGKIAIMGDKDLLQAEAVAEILTAASFTVLRDESLELFNGSPQGIVFIGIEPFADRAHIESILSNHSREDRFNILLIHNPLLTTTAIPYPIDIQLSGYCRGINVNLHLFDYPTCSQFYSGVYRFADHLLLNVNLGLNRPNHPLALLNRPTIDSFLLFRE